MKTAMQEFLDWYNNYIKDNGTKPSDYDVNYFITGQFIKLEKQQIIDAYIDRIKDTYNNRVEAEGYYNKRFKTKQ